ncbi:MAG: 5-(carboxyamino)imidazole ribonucleotide mutase [Chlorobium sp.]|uniref:5-(carboxyamino)imidazole ribonucleotide mutase n=1 Tax=Chlorobium sp. TaxID=1095 RepID=UPI0025B87E0F|nr:5-(carboxyamino)imidazole ribonucleotide mutase [Chlorobium sp.]MCF8215262.1 5-(carboxyamino)imidazole ribonucleotide mutase [Chlorobium sp.]MCF8270098.1 5-(carboxyamino)imidazole ribonucleotide mutase [Chlorobium sp.]MCF8286468.1 5-(carboxyamino)imidazole ribonucleotide mutase [Chlorobium sp.]MCF8290067.1 5-(carboxyamino)imidazole ribonucleotide mutase [Chlorobium sp.]MCF8384138.1 5-(carboxyamino)imidazole ribonucleotide mutase [Chlorobium sp.]
MTKNKAPLVGILMGSDSDFDIMKEALYVLDEFGIPGEISVISAHRTPQDLEKYASSAKNRGLKVIIAGAGGAAHLPGVTAAMTVLPVIGIPIFSNKLNGQDSLYSIVQMPAGIPVATVGIDNARNAALLAVQILALTDSSIMTAFEGFRIKLAEASRMKTARIREKLHAKS